MLWKIENIVYDYNETFTNEPTFGKNSLWGVNMLLKTQN